MPHQITTTDTKLSINVGGKLGTLQNAIVLGVTQAKKNDAVKAWIQREIDVRILLTDLPNDEPTKTVNPDQPNFFWGRSDGTPHPNDNNNDWLIARDTIVTDVQFVDGRYVVSQTTARREAL